MNKKILAALAALIIGAAALPARAGGHHGHDHHHHHPHGHGHGAHARVVRVEPLYERVRISVPVEHCWDERVRHVHDGPDRVVATLAGGAVGAVIGNHVSNGRGAGTVVGAIAGAVVGSELAGDGRREVHYRTVRRCEVRHEQRVEQRVVAYRVTYEHGGRRGTVRLAYDPGRYVAIADVRRRG
ncbi:MAG: glycine zipper 2TM domain-containing protein [Pseudomonadota bacterium]|jgi:uncharacterized protein YcfJ|nr:MAG: histidine kinase [Pseudomonadota bacterium]